MKVRIGAVWFLSVILLSCSASSELGRELRKSESERQDFRGMVVYDLARDKELLNHNGGKYFIPASTVKLFTFYTAHSTLPDSISSLEYLKLGDSLLIRGTADPEVMMSDPDPVLEFLKNADGNVFLVDRSIEDSKYGPGWSWDDYQAGFMPERNLFPLYGNLVTLSHGDSLETSPEFFRNSLVWANAEEINAGRPKMYRDTGDNRFYAGDMTRGNSRMIPFVTSNQLAADLLGEALGRKVTLVPDSYKKEFTSLKTRPYDSLYVRMLVESDNFIAEQLMLQVGKQVQNKYQVRAAISHALDSLLSDMPQRPRWVDGSGLSRYNLFTPESLVYLLKKMHGEIPEDQLLGYLAQGGVSGTLEENYRGPAGEPYVFAKSGTLSNNYCLSGFLRTKKGSLLAFSFMDNHYMGTSSSRKKELESLLETLWEGN